MMARYASSMTKILADLAGLMSEHQSITLEALSGRALNKGGFFDGLVRGRDCRTATAERLIMWFDAFWPDDLPWPEATVARPSGPQLPRLSISALAHISVARIWVNGRRPSWWADLEVREFLTSAHRQMSILRAAKIGAERFGGRCPKKSSIHLYWSRLDRLTGNDIPRPPKSKQDAA